MCAIMTVGMWVAYLLAQLPDNFVDHEDYDRD